jgi:hypothetical protein
VGEVGNDELIEQGSIIRGISAMNHPRQCTPCREAFLPFGFITQRSG